jgi:hypothetical protein
MAKRKQTHDRKVRQLANELKKKGYNVKADLKGFETPPDIGKDKHTPDIYAKRGSKTKIIEVDTPGTESSEQLSTFRRSVSQRKNADFEHVITKPKK